MKNHYLAANNNSGNDNLLGQVLGQSSKKDCRLYKGD